MRPRGTLGLSAALAAVLAVTGCVSAIPSPTRAHEQAAQAVYPGTTLEQLAEGRRLYIAKCAGCHQLYLPSHHEARRWPASVSSMAERAAIDARQEQAIASYLVAAAQVGAAD